MIISEEEKKSTAYHESGHVLVAKLIPGSDPVYKVTIIPRGRALGVTSYLPIDERHNYSRNYLETLLCHLLGGRVAEKLVMNQLTTGAGNDLERATELARKMVCEWGMSDKLGPVTFGKKDEEIFLGREIATHRDFSEKTAEEIDEEIRSIITNTEDRVEKLLSENLDKLHSLAKVLLEREILDGDEIDLVLNGEPLPEKKVINKTKKRRKVFKTSPDSKITNSEVNEQKPVKSSTNKVNKPKKNTTKTEKKTSTQRGKPKEKKIETRDSGESKN